MEIKHIINHEVENCIKNTFATKPEVRDWLLRHDRRATFEDNLLTEIRKTELSRPGLLKADTIVYIAKEYAKTFCHCAINAKEKELMTEGEVQRRRHEAHEFDEIQQMLEESSSGFTEDADGSRVED